ncbi:hypothetical protein [Pseudoclavibacter soli]|uniref:hypothetical protein n=1 Tax=Pseudoclavibacter soli TaxID=452623 RepID=UPI0003F6D698|nr:hypothetical protein [Pseudoclavibacter soli]
MSSFDPTQHPRGNTLTGHAGQFATKEQTNPEIGLDFLSEERAELGRRGRDRMSHLQRIYPAWHTAEDFDGPEDYATACANAENAFEPLEEFYVGEVLSMYDDDELHAGVVETLRAVFYVDRPSDHRLDAGEITEREWVELTAQQDIEDGEDQVVFDQIVSQWHELDEGRA